MQKIMDTIMDIYSTPGNINRWSNAIESILNLVGGQAGAYLLVNKENSVGEVSANHGFPSQMVQDYEGMGGANKDVRFKYLHKLIPGQVFREFEYIPDKQEYDDSEWIKYQYEEIGVYYSMAANISKHALWYDLIAINRLKTKGPHTDQDKLNLLTLLPHLSRAGELHRIVTGLEKRYKAVLSVLDKLLVGLVILDQHGRVVIENNMAQQSREASGAYTFTKNGYFKVFEETADLLFKEILKQTSLTSTRGEPGDGGQLVVKNRTDNGCLLLEIMPIRDDGFSDSADIQGTAIFIMDPDRAQYISTDGIASIFNLTYSESNIISSLINGVTVNDIADLRNTKVETVRGQLKAVFSKTGAKSQLDLIRLAVKANPPIEK